MQACTFAPLFLIKNTLFLIMILWVNLFLILNLAFVWY